MKNIGNKLAWVLIAVMLFTMIQPITVLADATTYEDAIDTTDAWLEENSKNDAWSVFARGRNLDADHTEQYYVDYYESVDVDALSSAGDNAKTLLALRASGRGDSEKATKIKERLLDWTNNSAWINSDAYTAYTVVDSISDELIKPENGTEKNAFVSTLTTAIGSRYDLWGNGADIDSTFSAAAALETLGYDMTDPEINGVITWADNLAPSGLPAPQNDDGSFTTWGEKSPETTGQVMILLAALNEMDEVTSNTGKTTIDGMMAMYDETKPDIAGGFGGGSPIIRAQQSNYALVAYDRMLEGKKSLYDFSDVTAVYYFSFDGNGASNTMKTQAIEKGETENLNANTLLNRGYRFIGWKDAEGNTYTDKQAVTASKDVKLYAVWQKIPTTTNTSSGFWSNAINLNLYYEEVMKVPAPNAERGEWVRNDSGKWTFFVDGKQVKGRWATAFNPAAGENKAGWFYFDDNGEMLVGWQQITGADGIARWYYLNPHPDIWYGACFRNTVTPDGYIVDAKGAWLDPNVATPGQIAKVTEKESSGGSSSGGSSAGSEAAENQKQASKISVGVSVSGNIVSGSDEVTLNKNASAYDALKAFAKKMGWIVSGSGSYVKGIGGEMEKSAGPLSGWVYTVNGNSPNKSASSCKLKDGDSVDWTFIDEPSY